MAMLPGFEYDIFISYRHNDNRSGWVTEFVKALQEELAATIKEPVSVYFDVNPHDGLLETHNVDKSLEGKLKCLIFIPILSQTYCDPKSFAWQHEFVAFNKMTKEDQFGRDIKLSNGNVASRILPIKIHDLDAEDKSTIENEIGSVLRAIEFIYKEPGVNRPIAPDDNQEKNLNKTKYKNQVNKVANAIKEIINALKHPVPPSLQTHQPDEQPPHVKKSKIKFILAGATIIALLIAAYFLYPKFPSPTASFKEIKKSIAVLPFVDMSPGKDQEWFSDGLSEEIINSLFQIKDLELRGRNSSFAFKGKELTISQLADTLGVNYIVEGSVRKFGDDLRVTVQLVQANDDVHLWSKQYDQKFNDIFKIQSDIANNVARSLKIYLNEEEKLKMFQIGTQNVDAYEHFLKGRKLYNDWHIKGRFDPEHIQESEEEKNDYKNTLWPANEQFDLALKIDSSIALAYYYRSDAFNHYLTSKMKGPPGKALAREDAVQKEKENMIAAIKREKDRSNRILMELGHRENIGDYRGIDVLVNDLIHDYLPNPFLSIDFVTNYVLLVAGAEKCMELINKDMIMDPQNTLLLNDKLACLISLNRFEEAVEVLKTLKKSGIQNRNEILEARIEMMMLLLKGKKKQVADSLLTIDKENVFAKALMGIPFDDKKALLQFDPDGNDITLCWAYWQSGQTKKANELIARIDQNYHTWTVHLLGQHVYFIPFELDAAPNLKKLLIDGKMNLKILKPMPIF